MARDGRDIHGVVGTGALTALTHTAPSIDDFAIQDFVDAVTGAFAFKTKDEAIEASVREVNEKHSN